jgi:hypothetical protein
MSDEVPCHEKTFTDEDDADAADTVQILRDPTSAYPAPRSAEGWITEQEWLEFRLSSTFLGRTVFPLPS